MTDGAVRTLLASGNQALIDRAVPHLLSRDLAQAWTSGQWMTETTGGSDVGRSETRAVPDRDGWRLYGRKWFTSAVTSQMALTLARPEGNAPGGKGLAMFYVEVRDASGKLNGITRRPAEGQARHAQGADGRADAGRHARRAGRCAGQWHARDRADAGSDAHVEQRVCRSRSCVAGWRWRAPMRPTRTAFGQPLAQLPLHADTLAGAGSGNLGRVPDDVPAGRAERTAGGRRDRRRAARAAAVAHAARPSSSPASRRSPSSAKSSRVSAARAMSRTPGCRSCCATRRCCRSGKARRTCWRSMR